MPPQIDQPHEPQPQEPPRPQPWRAVSRRHFLVTGSTAIAVSALAPAFFQRGTAQAIATPGATAADELAFGLFFDSGDLGRMRRSFESDTFSSLRDSLGSVDRDGMRRFISEEVRYNDQLFDIVRLSDTAQQMAMQYLMTGDEDAADLAASCIRSIMKFERWDYFLEAGERVVGIQRASSTVIAVAVCADWLGSFVTDEERASWLQTMKDRGCEPCFLSTSSMRHPERVVGWTRDESSTYFEHRPDDRADLSRRHLILDNTNLKAVPASALAIGAVCYMQHFGASADTERWVEQAVYSLGTFRDFFERDGSYGEGVSYANYTALNILKATSVLQRFALADLTDMINWNGYIDYAVGMSMPTADDPYDIVNFGDNGNAKSGEAGRPKRTAVALWAASNLNDRRAQWFGLELGGEHDEWALMWYQPRVLPESAPGGGSLYRSDLDWIVARTGYTADDLTVAMRSGGPANHEHADRNSLIVKCFGEQLVADPYRPPYAYRDPRWMMRTTAGHSAVLVDGNGHQYHDGTEGTNASEARARIIRSGERRGHAFWTSDATEAYALVDDDIASVVRTVVVVFGLPMVAIFDKLEKHSKPSRLQARYFGFNHEGDGSIAVDGNTFTHIRPRAQLVGHCRSSARVEVSSKVLPIPAEEGKKHPFAEVATIEPDVAVSVLALLVPVPRDEPTPQVAFESDGSRYRALIETSFGSGLISFDDTGRVPEFEVRL